jgi:hypothetical protein
MGDSTAATVTATTVTIAAPSHPGFFTSPSQPTDSRSRVRRPGRARLCTRTSIAAVSAATTATAATAAQLPWFFPHSAPTKSRARTQARLLSPPTSCPGFYSLRTILWPMRAGPRGPGCATVRPLPPLSLSPRLLGLGPPSFPISRAYLHALQGLAVRMHHRRCRSQ